jgi:hypothetical protein
MGRDEYLFSGADALSTIEHRRQQMKVEIAQMDGNRLLNTNVDDLVAYFATKYSIAVPELHEDQMSADQQEAKRDVSGDPRRMAYFGHGPAYAIGTEISIEIPFSGDAQLFKITPNTHHMSPPQGAVHDNVITFRHWTDKAAPEQVRPQIDKWLADVRQHLQWQRESFLGFNNSCAQEARQAIEHRRGQILKNQNLVAGLGIPIKRRADAPQTYTAPEVRRKLTPKMPPATVGPYKPEPILEEAEYQHILGLLESMVHVMERSPKAFHNIDEEALRTHFLVALNSHYEGAATGETFNYQGKTDILIRSDDRNIFIAECKFWSGPATVAQTIDQLLSYLSWRDSKAAILLFNRNKDFSKVLAEIPKQITLHPSFQKDEGQRGQTHFRYSFHHRDDPAKVIHLTVMAFDIPRPA